MTGKSPKKNFKKVMKYLCAFSTSNSTSKIPCTFIFEIVRLNKERRVIMHKYIRIRTIQSINKAANLLLIVARINSLSQ
jgi:hypothetical protein